MFGLSDSGWLTADDLDVFKRAVLDLAGDEIQTNDLNLVIKALGGERVVVSNDVAERVADVLSRKGDKGDRLAQTIMTISANNMWFSGEEVGHSPDFWEAFRHWTSPKFGGSGIYRNKHPV